MNERLGDDYKHAIRRGHPELYRECYACAFDSAFWPIYVVLFPVGGLEFCGVLPSEVRASGRGNRERVDVSSTGESGNSSGTGPRTGEPHLLHLFLSASPDRM